MDKKAECIQKGKNNQVGGTGAVAAVGGLKGTPVCVSPLCSHTLNQLLFHPPQTDCFNYVRFLQSYNSSHLYACGTYAFQPKCTYIVSVAPGGGPPPKPVRPWFTPPAPGDEVQGSRQPQEHHLGVSPSLGVSFMGGLFPMRVVWGCPLSPWSIVGVSLCPGEWSRGVSVPGSII